MLDLLDIMYQQLEKLKVDHLKFQELIKQDLLFFQKVLIQDMIIGGYIMRKEDLLDLDKDLL